MKLAPTLQGGIRIDIDSMLDWARLELICIDASKLNTLLSNNLAEKMNVEADWKNYVMPDLDAQFSEQISSVYSAIKTARSQNSETGEIHINPDTVDIWYGALNQARIALEDKYGLSKYNDRDLEELTDIPDEVKSALLRSYFYTHLQSELLDHVMSV